MLLTTLERALHEWIILIPNLKSRVDKGFP
jgi:hypothetical protein